MQGLFECTREKPFALGKRRNQVALLQVKTIQKCLESNNHLNIVELLHSFYKVNSKWKCERCIQTLTNNMVNGSLPLHDDTLKCSQYNIKKLL